MSLKTEIEKYLYDGYFAQGVRILAQLPGISPFQLTYFNNFLQSSYVPTGVETELRELIKNHLSALPVTVDNPEAKAAIEARERQKIKKAVAGTWWEEVWARPNVPEAIGEYYLTARRLHKEHSHLHAVMAEAAMSNDKKKAFAVAQKIMEEVIPELDAIYDAVRKWLETGTIIEVNVGQSEDLKQYKREQHLRNKRSKLRQWLDRGQKRSTGGKWVTMTKSEIEKYTAELRRIEEELSRCTFS